MKGWHQEPLLTMILPFSHRILPLEHCFALWSLPCSTLVLLWLLHLFCVVLGQHALVLINKSNHNES